MTQRLGALNLAMSVDGCRRDARRHRPGAARRGERVFDAPGVTVVEHVAGPAITHVVLGRS
jgi:hypothetical protein